MRRYLSPYFFFFDSTASALGLEIDEAWAPNVKESHERNRQQTMEYLALRLGSESIETKLRDFKDVGDLPPSVVSYHSELFRQCRDSFVSGAYYPALVGACALGERILNHLVIDLRGEFAATPAFGKVSRNQSFNDWAVMIDVLSEWRVLTPEVATSFKKLRKLRHYSVHYRPDLYKDIRGKALKALHTLAECIRGQFGTLGPHRWFIPGLKGTAFIGRDWETDPFVKRYYVVNTVYVGPSYAIRFIDGHVVVFDRTDYPDTEINDQTFADLLNNRNPESVVSTNLPPASNIDMRLLLPGAPPQALTYDPVRAGLVTKR